MAKKIVPPQVPGPDEIYKGLQKDDPLDSVLLGILTEEGKRGDGVKADFGMESKTYTICEVLREIFWISGDIGIRKRCMIAQLMAKRMSRKLQGYYNVSHPDVDWTEEKFFPPTPHHVPRTNHPNRKD